MSEARVVRARAVLLAVTGFLISPALSGCGHHPSTSKPQPSRISVLYTSAAPDVQQLMVAPDGQAAGYLDKGGTVHLFQADGRQALQYEEKGAAFAALSNSAERCVLAQKLRRGWAIKIITLQGETVWRQTMSDTLLDVAITPDGQSAFATTDGQRMYVIDLSSSPRWRRIRTDYTLSRLRYDPVAGALLVQTTQPMGFGMCTPEGKIRWWQPQRIGKFHLSFGAEGAVILTVLEHLSPRPGVNVTAYNAAGRQLFTRSIEGYDPRAAISADGKAIAVSFRRKLAHKDKSVMERRVALWDISGRTVWEQGGLFFKPVLQGLTDSPFGVLLAEDYTLLSAVDGKGRLAWRGPELPGRIVGLTHDDAWKIAWAQYTNGTLELWRPG